MVMYCPFLFISSTEIVFILFVVIMIFGADKLPEIARGLGKGMRTLKNATNDIKHEISKTAERNGIDSSITDDVTKEINQVKEDVEEFTGSIKRDL